MPRPLPTASACARPPNGPNLARHRLPAPPLPQNPERQESEAVSGIIEADESYFLKSEKGARKIKGQKSRKRGGKASKRGLSNVHAAVLIARDRTGATTDAVLETVDTQSIMTHLAPIVGDHHLDYPSCGDNHTRGSSASSPR